MAPRAFTIFRATSLDGSLDPQAKFIFEPSIDSDELFDALRTEYPDVKTHSERKRRAVLDFLVREREDDLRALDVLVSNEQVASPTALTRTASDQTPAGSSTQPTPESTGSIGQPSPIDLAPSAMFQTKPSGNSAFQVWDPSSNKPVKLHSRRRMTDQEKEEYRMRRLLGSCDSCKQKRRKCRHFLQQSSPSSKSRSKKTRMPRAPSSNTSPLINLQSASESGSDSSPTESVARSFSQEASSHQANGILEDIFPMNEFSLDQSFGGDFPLFSEAPADLDLLPWMTEQSMFSNTSAYIPPSSQGHMPFMNTDWAFDSPTLYNSINADWLTSPIDTTFSDFSQDISHITHERQGGNMSASPLLQSNNAQVIQTTPNHSFNSFLSESSDSLLGQTAIHNHSAQSEHSSSVIKSAHAAAVFNTSMNQQLLSRRDAPSSVSPSSSVLDNIEDSPWCSPQLDVQPFDSPGATIAGSPLFRNSSRSISTNRRRVSMTTQDNISQLTTGSARPEVVRERIVTPLPLLISSLRASDAVNAGQAVIALDGQGRQPSLRDGLRYQQILAHLRARALSSQQAPSGLATENIPVSPGHSRTQQVPSWGVCDAFNDSSSASKQRHMSAANHRSLERALASQDFTRSSSPSGSLSISPNRRIGAPPDTSGSVQPQPSLSAGKSKSKSKAPSSDITVSPSYDGALRLAFKGTSWLAVISASIFLFSCVIFSSSIQKMLLEKVAPLTMISLFTIMDSTWISQATTLVHGWMTTTLASPATMFSLSDAMGSTRVSRATTLDHRWMVGVVV